jgi:hypothetical protein
MTIVSSGDDELRMEKAPSTSSVGLAKNFHLEDPYSNVLRLDGAQGCTKVYPSIVLGDAATTLWTPDVESQIQTVRE